MKENVQLIWFKKNLRIKDNEVFQNLQSDTPTIGFFLLEEEIIKQKDFSYFHLKFIIESLYDLKKSLKELNIELIIQYSNFENFIQKIEKYYKIKKIISTQETGNMKSYKRDLRVINYLNSKKIIYEEVVNNGIVRKLKNRNDWSKIWKERIEKDFFEEVVFKKFKIQSLFLQETEENLKKYLEKTKHFKTQLGGEEMAHKVLESFLNKRVEKYSYNIGKPFESTNYCSRLSPYITYGNISVKYIYRKSLQKIIELNKNDDNYSKNRKKQINFFISRLYWQSHFIQKLETMPSIEFENISKSFNEIRTQKDQKIIDDFFDAKTGIPYIDAAIKCLKQTGWINFRTRACLVSYICNTMMQPWQEISKPLACLFTDYEPGIHYSQIQMQAGTSGINTIRIYNPIKQSKEKDFDGKFIKKWIPELKNFDKEFIHEPWKSDKKINGYTNEINIEELNKNAREVLWGVKESKKNKNDTKKIYKKIGSRKNIQKRKKEKNINQLKIF